jgi:hypothetical protein
MDTILREAEQELEELMEVGGEGDVEGLSWPETENLGGR